ncbi:protein cornichon homolog 1 isoform X1 [Vigna radiata var. radiata]|uniref:Protein cornichon homolog 1 isoform X1 n=1 Tax=Vigna radiata var. radiata TaxID=3916 RepID=A0A1S3UZ89_VIGRR|nr:protein cornichon homolog 1 isoform X1 [Vigna radiata var. radiata]XP_014511263.1 protein cornichon homolog 1 isoform X1 [Vigna radiata var. radiata]XP_014511264.1 protein cornichon homolog 1 isoform X1 [Vigna radiata var. radiata]
MGWNLVFWLLICFPANIALLASTFYQVLILSDLESDYVNPFDASSRINYFVLPEFIGQGALCALCLFTGHWFMFLLTVPVTCYHARLYVKREHLIDVTEVFRVVNAEKKFRIVKLALYLTVLIVTIFRMLAAGTIIFYNSKFQGVDIRSNL